MKWKGEEYNDEIVSEQMNGGSSLLVFFSLLRRILDFIFKKLYWKCLFFKAVILRNDFFIVESIISYRSYYPNTDIIYYTYIYASNKNNFLADAVLVNQVYNIIMDDTTDTWMFCLKWFRSIFKIWKFRRR